jgi:soluble lytic murein transglycosylase
MRNPADTENRQGFHRDQRSLALLAATAFSAILGFSPARAVDDVSWFEPSPAQIIAFQPGGAVSARPGLSEPGPAIAEPAAGFDQRPTATIAATILTAQAARAAPQDDLQRLKAATAAIGRGRSADADKAIADIVHPAARLAAEWVLVRSGSPQASFQRIVAFMQDHGGWAPLPPLQRRAEEALLSQRVPAPRVLAFFADRAPITPAGRAAHVMALKQTGADAEAGRLARLIWRDDHLGRELEAMMLKTFGDALTPRDHRNRMEMYLFKDNSAAALRSAQRAGPDHARLVQARVAVARKSSGAAGALAAVPAALRADSSFVFAQAQHHRRRQEADIAARLIAALPRDAGVLVDGDEWWVERRLIARQLLDRGLHAEAYQVAAQHSAEKPPSIIEAEWHAGWIALGFLKDPVKAAMHFEAAARQAETPISLARAAYWRGRAAEAAGEHDRAQAHFEAASGQHIAYYGQIARAKLGQAAMPLRALPAIADAAGQHPSIALIETLEAADEHPLARGLILELARHLDDAAAVGQLATIAARVGDARLLVSLGKTAVQRGMPLDLTAYPTDGMPAFESPVERAIVFAIARQESAFDPRAVSHAGARGLMQMMLPTARETARRIKTSFEAGRLTSDPAYNAKLGAAHLADLIAEWRGSYVLTFAAYNAGSGNVRDWIEAYGDPRDPAVDVIDWVERIPFTETRNYVQRVMENLQVYRARLEADAPLLIATDLARGVRSAHTANAQSPKSASWASMGPLPSE